MPLLPYCDALMLTRGILRTTVPPAFRQGVVMRASGGPSIRKELSNELLAVDIEDALRMNVSAMAVQVYVGGEFETQTVNNMTRMVDMGNRYGMPTLGVTAVGKDMVRDAQYFRLATRICAELGAQFVKTYYVAEGFETVTASCPVPIVMAGGKKLPELEALTMAYRAVSEGAAGVDMGRNIFQSEAPVAMIQAVQKVVHELMKPEHAFELYQTLRHEQKRAATGMSRRSTALLSLRPAVSVGLLTADLLSLGSELSVLERAGIGVVHVDVMDGVFTPVMTVGPPFVKALRTPLLKDVHLMIREPLATLGRLRGRRRGHHHRPPGVVHAHPPGPAGAGDDDARRRPGARHRARRGAQSGHAARGDRAAAARDGPAPAARGQPGVGRPEVHPRHVRPDGPGQGDDRGVRPARSSSAWTAA